MASRSRFWIVKLVTGVFLVLTGILFFFDVGFYEISYYIEYSEFFSIGLWTEAGFNVLWIGVGVFFIAQARSRAPAEFREKAEDRILRLRWKVPHEPNDSSSENLPSPPTPPEPVAWCYVSASIDVLDLQSSDRTVGQLVPGNWYLRKRETDGWAHVADPESGLEGWVPGGSVSVR